MKKLKYLFIIQFFFASCNLGDVIDLNTRINAYVQSYLDTEEVNTSISWGDDEIDNNIKINLTNYNLADKSDKYLDSVSNDIRKHIIERFPETKKVSFIEINFIAPDSVTKGRKNASFR